MTQYGPAEWFYPTGALAVNQRAAVFGPGDQNTFASIFSDPAMTVPLANPTTTDALGLLEFYAADGTYWIFVGSVGTGDSVEVTLGASPDNPVLSVNGQAPDGGGNVELDAGDVGADPAGSAAAAAAASQPLATINAKGDLYAGTGNDATARRPVGADGLFLVADSSQPTGLNWAAAGGGGGTVDSVNGVGPDGLGNVQIDAADVGADPAGSAAAALAAAQASSQQLATIDAKGDLYAGTGPDATARQAVGADGTVLTADAAQSTGMRWAVNPAGDVVGPAVATDNAVARFDSTTGKLIQSSGLVLTDGGTLVFPLQAPIAYAAGSLYYDSVRRALTFLNDEPDVAMDIGQELWLEVHNVTASTIPNGAAVYISGTHASGVPTVALAQANAMSTALVVGVATHAIEANTNGFVTIHGVVHGIDTSAFSGGNAVYLSATTPGAYTATPPTAPNFAFRVGVITKANPSTGSMTIDGGSRNLGLGTANQVLGINNGATAQEYKTLSGTTNRLTVTHGAGTVTFDVATALSDSFIPKSLVDAKADLLVGTADDTLTRLGVGVDGLFLVANSAQPTGLEWAAAPGASSPLPGALIACHNRLVYPGNGVTFSVASIGNNTQYYIPVSVDKACTWIGLQAEISATVGEAGSVLWAGYYAADASTGAPTGSPVASWGNVAATATGFKNWAFSAGCTPGVQLYASFVYQGATGTPIATLRRIATAAGHPAISSSASLTTGGTTCYVQTGVTANPPGAVGTISPNMDCPRLGLTFTVP